MKTRHAVPMRLLFCLPVCLMLCLLCMLCMLAWAPPGGAADTSTQDTDLAVYPIVRWLPVTSLGSDSAPVAFTVTNRNTSETRALGVLSLGGPNADQFVLPVETDACSNKTLAANGGSCTVQVKFHPTRRGTKAASLLIPSDAAQTPVLTAFVSNCEAASDEAMRRMPPVLAALDIPETMKPGQTYTLTWSLEGYHSGYSSYMVFFDCTGVAQDCGASYGDSTRFAESTNVNPVAITDGSWQFSGVVDQRFSYSWDFTVPLVRKDSSPWPAEGADIVVRLYCKDDIDQERNSRSVSLLIPGNLSDEYYDTGGRSIVKQIKY
jgi:hypothetical protein